MKSHNLFNSKTKTEIQLRFIIAKMSTRSMQNCIQAYLSEYWHVTDNAIIVINETCKYLLTYTLSTDDQTAKWKKVLILMEAKNSHAYKHPYSILVQLTLK